MEHLNIAFYSDDYLPAVDGVVTSILNFKKGLEKKGHTVYIFTAGDGDHRKKYERDNVFVTKGIKFAPYPQYRVAVFPYLASLKAVKLGVDLVHIQTPFTVGLGGLITAKMMNYPVVGSFHTLLNHKEIISSYYPKNRFVKNIMNKYMWSYMRFVYNRCDSTIAPSKSIEKLLRSKRIKNVHMLPNGIDTSIFNQKADGSAIRARYGIKDSEKVVLYLGRLSAEKKVDTLLKAAKVLLSKDEKIRFVIAGTGPMLGEYKRMSSSLGIEKHVIFAGFVEQEEVANMYAAADVFCIPSTFETQGIVAVEAMAVGKPVVGADHLALSELIVNGKNGEKFAPNNYIQCARKIEKVLNNAEAYKREALKTAEKYSIENTTERLIDIYNLVLS
ncbi:MAG: glycosyltransferase [Candidatus Micrarchaeia archaeon]